MSHYSDEEWEKATDERDRAFMRGYDDGMKEGREFQTMPSKSEFPDERAYAYALGWADGCNRKVSYGGITPRTTRRRTGRWTP